MNNYETIRKFVNSRPGFCSANYYGNPQGYRRDQATARNQKKAAIELLDLAERLGVEFADTTPQGLRGRFYLENGQAEYLCGQYYPTEYRGQVAAFVARHIQDKLEAKLRKVLGDDWSAIRASLDAVMMSRNARAYW